MLDEMDEQTKIALEKQNPWWFNKPYLTGVPRLKRYPSIVRYINTPEILFILGARRIGKSTLLHQVISSLNAKPNEILFINLDEPLFQSKANDPSFLTNLIEEHITQHNTANTVYVFIDELQNYNYWVQTIKTIYDINQNIKFILTGSTSTLLKNELSTRLSGRYLNATVHTLSFSEFLEFNEIVNPSVLQKKQLAEQYIQFGAFPRVVLEKDELIKQDLLKNYFQTIYLKDIIYPNKIRNTTEVFDLLYFVLSNVGKLLSYNKIGKLLNISTDTVKEYLMYAEQAYLISSIMKYDASLKKQLANPQKIYCMDTGIVNSVSFKFSENKGRIMENLVFTTLNRKQNQVFYHKSRHECDFVIKEGIKITQAIQATVSLQDAGVRKRELKGILEAMNAYELSEGIIITESENEIIETNGKIIKVIPLYDWLEKN